MRQLQNRLLPIFWWATFTVALLAAVAFAAFVFRQDLRVAETADGVVIDVRWLGEYQSNVREIRISERPSGRVVWNIRAINGQTFPLWVVRLHAGANPVMPDGVAGAEVVTPRVEAFELSPATDYRVDLWTTKDWGVSRHVSTKFTLARRQGA